MSEAEPIPPTSSVTALRIPMIKKGEYDLWSMKMRQYIAITDHILWDIITNGDQATTDPVSSSGPVSAPKTSLAANARRNNEKALNILLSAIPDRHLLSFHDAEDAKTLWSAIKARFGGNEASKKMQKNLLKQQFETFTIGSREELDSAYERFQNILSMLELYDAKVSHEDANLKFLRSLPSVWHVVATMIRGQPGLDELEFDDLYNNLKVYEHELKGVSNSSSQNIAFLSTEIKGSTLKQSTADPENIPKGYTQAASSKVQTAPNCASHSDEIICSFFAQQASMPTTHDDEDLLQIDEDAMEEIDIRWQVAMITARIRKFMRKTGRPIDLKPKNGITFDKSKIECFNCQKLGHFARECRFAKYQENRANGRKEKKIVAIEDSNSKALVATDNNEEIDWTKEFDAEPVTFAMMALTELEEDDWSMEIDAEPVHFGQDGLGDFDWSNKADDTPVSLALMATNSEVPYCSKCSKSYKQLLENYQTERDNFQKARSEILGYQMSLESLEVILKTHEKNEYAWVDKYEQMEYDLKMRDFKVEEKQKELDQDLGWNLVVVRKVTIHLGNKNREIDGVAERRNRTLIEAARTMLVDAKLPVTFWAEAVSTACLCSKQNWLTSPKITPYEIFNGRSPAIGSKTIGCHVRSFNTIRPLSKFDAKGDEVESEVPTVSLPVPTVSTNVLDSELPELPASPIVETVVPTVSTPIPTGSTILNHYNI
ncbi:ribonuclease H-like domain-containing protein [Tanacetum coccineum]